MAAQVPAMINRHLDCIQHNEDTGGLLLTASSLTGRYWTGSLWYYSDADAAPDVSKCKAGAEVESGINDAKWINGTKLVAGSDSGSVMVWELQEDYSTFTCLSNPIEHDGIVYSVSLNAAKDKAVSASQDRVIKVWDLEKGASIHSFKGHSDIVSCASCHPTESDVFISCSQDGTLVLWDLRKSKPASHVVCSALKTSVPSCVEWQANTPNHVAIGTEAGQVVLHDVHSPQGNPTVIPVHSRPVHRLLSCPSSRNWLATASEDCTASVIDLSAGSGRVISRIQKHTDFVQGLSWTADKLYTCSWDSTILSHSIRAMAQNGQEETMEIQSPSRDSMPNGPEKMEQNSS